MKTERILIIIIVMGLILISMMAGHLVDTKNRYEDLARASFENGYLRGFRASCKSNCTLNRAQFLLDSLEFEKIKPK